MNIIDIYDKLKSSYKNYIGSFVSIKDERIKQEVSDAIQDEKLWPKALIQFNPNFAQGVGVTQLIEQGLPIHKDLERFLRPLSISTSKKQLSWAVKIKSLS